MRVIFFGTPHFAEEILAYLLERKIDIIAVVTKEDKPTGRGQHLLPPPVKILAEKQGIPVYQPKKASAAEFVTFLEGLRADLFIVVAFAEILKENLLRVPPKGCLNVHASLLPKYRGAAPIARAIWAGEKESGISIMKIDAGIDTGGVLAEERVAIPPDMTAGELADQLAKIGAKKLFEILQKFSSYHPHPQSDDGASYAKKIRPEEQKITWDRPAEEVYCHIRALLPHPGVWSLVTVRGESKRLKIRKARLEKGEGKPGEILKTPLVIACKTGAIALLEVQLEGKKAMTSEDFMRGIDNITF